MQLKTATLWRSSVNGYSLTCNLQEKDRKREVVIREAHRDADEGPVIAGAQCDTLQQAFKLARFWRRQYWPRVEERLREHFAEPEIPPRRPDVGPR